MCAAGQLQPAASADLRPTFASGLYFQTKPSTCGLIPIAKQVELLLGGVAYCGLDRVTGFISAFDRRGHF